MSMPIRAADMQEVERVIQLMEVSENAHAVAEKLRDQYWPTTPQESRDLLNGLSLLLLWFSYAATSERSVQEWLKSDDAEWRLSQALEGLRGFEVLALAGVALATLSDVQEV